MKNMMKKIIEFRDERGWGPFHKEKDLAISISLEASELLEISNGRAVKRLPPFLDKILKKKWQIY